MSCICLLGKESLGAENWYHLHITVDSEHCVCPLEPVPLDIMCRRMQGSVVSLPRHEHSSLPYELEQGSSSSGSAWLRKLVFVYPKSLRWDMALPS